MEGFGAAMESRSEDPDKLAARCRANTLLYLAEAAGYQSEMVLQAAAPSMGMTAKQMKAAFEAAGDGLVSQVTSFVTQMLHMSLEIWPRLVSQRLVSVQPLMQPNGYVFYMKHYDQTNRDLADLDTFSSTYTSDPGEGAQIKKVRSELTKQLVEVNYRKLMWQQSHEVAVAMFSQYKIRLEDVNDSLLSREMAWEVDRTVVDELVGSAGTSYHFDPNAAGAYNGYTPSEKQAYDKNFLRITMAGAEAQMTADVYRLPNWAIAGTNVIKFLARLPEYNATRSDGMNNQQVYNGSLINTGKLNNLEIWHDPQIDSDLMLIGYTEPNDPFYAGFIFAPFGLATVLTAAFTDPNNLLTRKARAIAFATKMIRPQQYARIYLSAS